jgi:hypothetical protein
MWVLNECGKCKEVKLYTEFSIAWRKVYNFGRSYTCKSCVRESKRKEKGTHYKLYLREEGKKLCWKCDKVKSLEEFGNNKSSYDGRQARCKPCKSIEDKEYRQRLRDKGEYLKRKKAEYERNKDTYKTWSANRDRDYKSEYKRFKQDDFKVYKQKIRSLILVSIKKMGYSKKSKTNEILGCSFEVFKQHIERQFKKGMTWNNHGEWHLDHIIPMASATTEEEVLKLNHYTNFQPLWAEDNLKKSDKIIEPIQIKLRI